MARNTRRPTLDPRPDRLRDLARIVAAYTGAEGLACLANCMGYTLHTGHGNLGKWIIGANPGYSDADRAALQALLQETKIGRALCQLVEKSQPVVQHLIDTITSDEAQLRAGDLCGTFLAYHGSHLVPDHYVVRAIKIEPHERQSYLVVEDRLSDNKTISGIRDHAATGIAAMVDKRPHLLLIRKDNSQGFNLIVLQEIVPEKGPMQMLIGQMLGMTAERRHFSRAILLVRENRSGDIKELLSGTGIRPFDRWSRHARARFQTLAKHLPQQPFPDPILLVPPPPEP